MLNVKVIDVFISRLMENVVYVFSGILFSFEKEEVFIYYDVIKFWGYYIEWNKLVVKFK